MKRSFVTALLLLACAAPLPTAAGCVEAQPIPPSPVLIVEASEPTSDYLHSTCNYLGVFMALGTARMAQDQTQVMGGNVMMPLGGVRESYSNTSTTNYTTYSVTTTRSWSTGRSVVAAFQCPSLPNVYQP